MNNNNEVTGRSVLGALQGLGMIMLQICGLAAIPVAAFTLHLGQWIILLAVIVSIFAHEFGHWFFARCFGIDVPVFSIGFFRPILKLFRFMDTDFQITPWFILGGYVQIDPSSEQFRRKAAWKRAIVLVAGVAMNGLLAIGFLSAGYVMVGKPAGTVNVVQLPAPQTPAAMAGIQPGDIIVAIDGIPTHQRRDVITTIILNHSDGSELQITTQRGRETRTFALKPDDGRIGVMMDEHPRFAPVGAVEAVELSVLEVKAIVSQTVTSLGMFTGILPHPKEMRVRGMIALVQIGGTVYEQSLFDFMWMLAAVNISLLVMNLLPLPVLDGGHLFNIAYEKVMRRYPSPAVQSFLTNVTLILMGALMALTLFNDIFHPIG